MKQFTKILSGVGFLIAIYLFVSNADATVNIIGTIFKNATQGIQVLQGKTPTRV